MLAARQLSLQYPGKRLCRSLNFEVNPGECWAILGQNGCGKTTLLHALGGLRAPDSGTVTIQGNAISALPRRERACKLGVMLQEEPGEFWGTVRDYILLGRYPHVKSLFGWDDPDYAMVEKVIAKLDLSQLAVVTLSAPALICWRAMPCSLREIVRTTDAAWESDELRVKIRRKNLRIIAKC